MKGCMIGLRVEHFTLSVDCDLIGAERSTLHSTNVSAETFLPDSGSFSLVFFVFVSFLFGKSFRNLKHLSGRELALCGLCMICCIALDQYMMILDNHGVLFKQSQSQFLRHCFQMVGMTSFRRTLHDNHATSTYVSVLFPFRAFPKRIKLPPVVSKVLVAGIVGAMIFGTYVTLSLGAVAGAEWFFLPV